jgi:uncharacterized OB-fold protein
MTVSSDAPAPSLPQPDPLTRPFWDACRRRSLEVQSCAVCECLFLPPGPRCPRCWSDRFSARSVSGEGTVETFAVYRRTYHPARPAPYVVALIQLREGPRLISNVVGCRPEEVAIGMRVRVRFEDVGDLTLPQFEPSEESP